MGGAQRPFTVSLVLPGLGPPDTVFRSLDALLRRADIALHSLYATGIDALPAALVARGLTERQSQARIAARLEHFLDGLGRHAIYGPFNRHYAAGMLGVPAAEAEIMVEHAAPPLSESAWRECVAEMLELSTATDRALSVNGLGLGVIDLRRGSAEVLTPPHSLDRLMAATVNPLQFPPVACAGLLAGHQASAAAHLLVDRAVRHMACDAVLVLRGEWRSIPSAVDQSIGLAEQAMLTQSIAQANRRVDLTGLGPLCIDVAAPTPALPPPLSALMEDDAVRGRGISGFIRDHLP